MKIVSFFGLNRKFQLQVSHRFKIRNNNTHTHAARIYTHSDVIVAIALPRCDWMWELSVQCTQPDLCWRVETSRSQLSSRRDSSRKWVLPPPRPQVIFSPCQTPHPRRDAQRADGQTDRQNVKHREAKVQIFWRHFVSLRFFCFFFLFWNSGTSQLFVFLFSSSIPLVSDIYSSEPPWSGLSSWSLLASHQPTYCQHQQTRKRKRSSEKKWSTHLLLSQSVNQSAERPERCTFTLSSVWLHSATSYLTLV